MSIFFCSDHHFGHAAILTFENSDGSKLRYHSDMNEMHDTIVYRHNEVVKKSDTVYFLGDVCINLPHIEQLDRMNGKKILIKGNHDIFHINHYLKYFEDICAYKVFPKHFICSHIPLHPNSIQYELLGNVHGHTHKRCLDDKRYFNVSLEAINYTPVEFNQIKFI